MAVRVSLYVYLHTAHRSRDYNIHWLWHIKICGQLNVPPSYTTLLHIKHTTQCHMISNLHTSQITYSYRFPMYHCWNCPHTRFTATDRIHSHNWYCSHCTRTHIDCCVGASHILHNNISSGRGYGDSVRDSPTACECTLSGRSPANHCIASGISSFYHEFSGWVWICQQKCIK